MVGIRCNGRDAFYNIMDKFYLFNGPVSLTSDL